MKRNSLLLVNSTHKTKSWWVFLSVLLLVIVPFVIVWVLVGEFNALDLNWLIAKNQSVWHGIVTNDNLEILAQKYSIFHAAGEEDLKNWLATYIGSGKQGSIISDFTFFNVIILAPLLGLFAWSIIYPIIFNATKVSGLDVLPFSSALSTFMLILVISGLMDVWESFTLYFVVRILIAFVGAIIIFMIANLFVNKFLSTRSYAIDMVFGYKSVDKANEYARDSLKKNVETFKKQKDEDTSYVELPKED